MLKSFWVQTLQKDNVLYSVKIWVPLYVCGIILKNFNKGFYTYFFSMTSQGRKGSPDFNGKANVQNIINTVYNCMLCNKMMIKQ